MKVSFERRLILFFTIIFLGIIILGIFAINSNKSATRTNESIEHAKEVIAESERILSLSKDIIIGGQRYVITGNTSFIDFFYTTRDSIFSNLQQLKGLTQNNSLQQPRIDSLNLLMKNRIDFSELYIRLRRERGVEAAAKLIGTGRGKFYMDNIRNLIVEVERDENNLLQQREAKNNRSVENFNRAFYALLFSVFTFLIGVFFYIRFTLLSREKVENDLKISRENFKRLFEYAPYPMWVYDLETLKFLEVNRAAITQYGYSHDEFLNMHVADVRPAEEIPRLMESVKTRGEIDIQKTDGWKHLLRNGQIIDVEITSQLFSFREHKAALVIANNITERKKSEEQLRQNEEQIQAIFKGAPDAVITIDDTGKIVQWNPKAESLFGWNSDEVTGKLLSETIIPHRYREAHQKGMQHFLKTGEGPVLDRTIEIQAVNKNNVEFEVALSISPTLTKDGYLFIGFLRDITEKKRMDEEMKQTNHFLDTILENIPNMIFVKDAKELRFIRFNKAGEDLLGYSRKDLLGKNDYDFFPKEQADFFTNKDRDVINQGDLLDIAEEPIDTGSGKRFLHTKKIPISDERGSPLYLLGISEDITERKKAEQLLQDLNEQFLKIFNLGPVAMSISNYDDGRITEVNESFEQLFGIKREDAAGKTFADLKIRKPGERDQIMEYLKKTGGHARGVEMKLRRANGEIMDALSSVEIIEIGNKKFLLSAAMDMTEQKKSEQRLQELHERFLKIFNLSPVAMCISGVDDGHISMINETFEKLFLMKREEVLGKTVGDLKIMSSALRTEILSNIEKEGGHSSGLELKFRKANDQVIDALVSVEFIEIDNKKSILSAVVDISERKRSEDQIIHLNAELSKNIELLQLVNNELEAFTYSVSHDLRAPLRIIDGYAGILVSDYKSVLDAEGNKTIEVIRSNARKMGQLIDDLLNLSRLGRKELTLNKVDMNNLVSSVLVELGVHDLSPEPKIITGKLESIYCDKALMNQVWHNLISNAVKYSRSKDKPVIEIGSEKKGNEVIYFVKDNGVGFDLKYADKLFGVFQRLHKMTEFEGTGVGLAIVKRIIGKHNGRVWADAEVDKGATFYFSLPV